jgi:hypothetical protein
MRTTVTLDPDTAAIVKSLQQRRGLTFKEAINEAIRSGARSGDDVVEPPQFDMGPQRVDLDHALRILAELEDAETVRKIEMRK